MISTYYSAIDNSLLVSPNRPIITMSCDKRCGHVYLWLETSERVDTIWNGYGKLSNQKKKILERMDFVPGKVVHAKRINGTETGWFKKGRFDDLQGKTRYKKSFFLKPDQVKKARSKLEFYKKCPPRYHKYFNSRRFYIFSCAGAAVQFLKEIGVPEKNVNTWLLTITKIHAPANVTMSWKEYLLNLPRVEERNLVCCLALTMFVVSAVALFAFSQFLTYFRGDSHI